MFFYLAQFLLLFSLAVCYHYSRDRFCSSILKLLCFCILFLPAAFRSEIGTDYNSYLRIYQILARGNIETKEIGWKLINMFVYKCDFGPRFIFVIASFITYFMIFRVRKQDFFLVIMFYYLYLYTSTYNIVRQMIAFAFVWYGFYTIQNGKKGKGLIIALFGLPFHTSTIVCIPLLLAMNIIKLNKRQTLFLCILSCITVYLGMKVLMELLNNSAFYYVKYFARAKYANAAETNTGLGRILRLLMIFFSYILCDSNSVSKREFSNLSVFVLGLWLTELMAMQMFVFSRLTYYFVIAYLEMNRVIFKQKNRNYMVLMGKYAIAVYTVLIVFLLSLLQNSNEIVPYTYSLSF